MKAKWNQKVDTEPTGEIRKRNGGIFKAKEEKFWGKQVVFKKKKWRKLKLKNNILDGTWKRF